MAVMQDNQALGCRIYAPTREDIRRASKEIQATWSPQERAKRNRGPHAAWWIPSTIRLFTLVAAGNEETQTPSPSGSARCAVGRPQDD
jgi:hypothetical protein